MSNYKVLVSASAEHDLDNAIIYYKNVAPNIAQKFALTIEKQIENILHFPFAYPIKYKNFRTKIVHGFPYIIIYDIVDNIIFIDRIFNTHQKTEWH